jgi:Na+-driven multidrug efflux pump
MRIIVLVNPVIGFQIVVGHFFQSIGMPKKSIFLSLSRQLLFLIPMLFVLPEFFGTKGVWMSMPAADSISAIVAAVMIWKFYKNGAFKNKEMEI